MIFTETPLAGAFVIEPERMEDARGFFARTFDAREFEAHGLNARIAQTNLSHNPRRGTLRGHALPAAALRRGQADPLHARRDPRRDHRPAAGLRDAARRTSESASTRTTAALLYVPEGFAHGFLTLDDDTEVSYQISQFYSPEHGAGVRWNDPAFGIAWPGDVTVIAERDRTYPDFRE